MRRRLAVTVEMDEELFRDADRDGVAEAMLGQDAAMKMRELLAAEAAA